jgi:hypothetical protein
MVLVMMRQGERIMRNMKLGLSVFGLVLAMLVWFGCEDSPQSQDAILNVVPASAVVRPGHAVRLTAGLIGDDEEDTNSTATVYYPLEWTMSDPALGEFIETAGNSAVYRATASGINTITVRDKTEREGISVISQ